MIQVSDCLILRVDQTVKIIIVHIIADRLATVLYIILRFQSRGWLLGG